ncbi:MAG: T9SS type A sorting domain-containing protein [Prevotella sp.]|nr:T9SS type A sorting domain-containing protein [Prevotella sp.]
MKHIVMTACLLLSFLMTMAENPKTFLVVRAKDGTKVAYALEEKPKMTFTKTDLVINTNSGEIISYSLENMARFTYEDNSIVGITNIKTGESPFEINDESLIFPALKGNSVVSIYSLNGTLVFKETIRQEGEYAFPLSNLNAGVYLVTVNGLTYKIVKK